MMRLNCRIVIRRQWLADEEGTEGATEWRIDKVESIDITGDSETLADTCTIVLPRNIKWTGDREIPIRRGDDVTVWLGYDGREELRFLGMVKEVSAKTPTKITCEDWMMRLRNKNAKRKTYANCTLTALLDDQMEGLSIRRKESGEVHLGTVRVEATNVAGVLSELKKNYGIISFFALDDDVPTLYSYTVFPEVRRKAGRFSEGVNIIENDLEYRRAADVQVKIRGISIQEDNSRLEYAEGEGEERVIYRYNLNMAQLKIAVKDELHREKWEGLQGSFLTFGMPRVEKMDVVELQTEGTKGIYQVKAVDISFGQGGYRQKIELKRRVAEL